MRCGYVTREAAEKYYGAVFQPDSLSSTAGDASAPRSMRQQGLPHDQPITEVSSRSRQPRSRRSASIEHEKLTEEERVAFAMRCRCCS